MTLMTKPPEPTGPTDDPEPFYKRFWPFQWLVSNSFWEDVTSRTVAAGIVALVGLLGANAAGLFNKGEPSAKVYNNILLVVIDVVIVLLGLLVIVLFAETLAERLCSRGSLPGILRIINAGSDESEPLSPILQRFIRIVVWVIAFFLALILILKVDGFRQEIPFVKGLVT
jgi:hypothetical protein